MLRKFKVNFSPDKGDTWKDLTADGWAITDLDDNLESGEYGYVLAVDIGDTMVDVIIPERMFKFMLKDIEKRRAFDSNGGTQEQWAAAQINKANEQGAG